MCLWNVRSIVNKLKEFSSFVYATSYDIYAITETWLSNNIYDNEIVSSGYNIYRKDRKTRGGGVMFVTNNSIPSKIIPTPEDIEVLSVQLLFENPINLCLLYNPPGSGTEYQQKLLTYLTSLVQSDLSTVIMGDLNAPDIIWSSLSADSDFSNKVCDLIFQYNLNQIVEDSTHIRGNILDVVITNIDESITNLLIQETNNLPIKSDHYLITFEIQKEIPCVNQNNSSTFVLDYNKANFEEMNNYLLELDLTLSDDVECSWSIVKSAILHAITLFVPKIKFKSNNLPKYFTSNIKHQINCIRTLRKKKLRSPTNYNTNRLLEAELCLSKDIAQAKSNYESKLIQDFASHNQPKIYRYIRNLRKSDSLPSSVSYDNNVASEDHARALLFNKFFYSVFTTSNINTPSDEEVLDTSTTNHIISIDISEDEVFNALIILDPNKATGIDGIGPKILKHCAAALYKPFHYLYSLILRKHTLPLEWCIHCIIPVFKSGDKALVTNYRPISLLCNSSKILEQLIYNKIIDHIIRVISPLQFGFLKHRSVVQQLLILFNNILCTCHQTDILYLDFRKAFDSVPHNELLQKLKAVGISGNLWLFFKFYLLNRQQCVKVNNQYSDLLPVKSGIPQGSILGPILFLIYINDLPEQVLFSILFLFADDTKCFKSICDSHDYLQLQKDLNSLYSWSIRSNLLFSLTKILHMSFKSTITTSYSIGTNIIPKTETHRDLGIILSSNLSWEPHYHHILGKAYKVLGLLRRTFSINININCKKQLYISLVRSQLMFSSVLWKPHLIKHIQLLERIQRRATKYILNDYTSDYRTRLIKLKLLPFMYVLDINDIMFFITSLKFPTSSFNINDYVHFTTGSTRQASSNKLQHIRKSDNHSRNFYFYRLPRIWNALPIINHKLLRPVTIKYKLQNYFYNHFERNFVSSNACTYSFLCPCSRCSQSPNVPNYDYL